ncbi:MAG TPA: hypothetical protein PK275_06765 [Chitinophagaceae bacterium]|jgi:hypothetical protein|nr:hypothetical protein [Ferruginibacter sp.]HUM97539.1 hypothetical protein [Chitinophagaceae bacterium]
MKTLSLILFFIIAHTTSRAQQITNAAGNSNTVGSISIDWSFGELTLVDEKRLGSLIISQGVLQPEKGIFKDNDDNISQGEIKILPNPTSGVLNIWAGFLTAGKLRFDFYDTKGSRVISEEKTYTGFNTYQFVLDRYAAASYPLKITWQPANGKTKTGNYIIIKQ